MIIEAYESEKEGCISFVIAGNTDDLEPDAVLINSVEGLDWDSCMQKHYDFLDWGIYEPIK